MKHKSHQLYLRFHIDNRTTRVCKNCGATVNHANVARRREAEKRAKYCPNCYGIKKSLKPVDKPAVVNQIEIMDLNENNAKYEWHIVNGFWKRKLVVIINENNKEYRKSI